MTDDGKPSYHINQVVPDIVNQAFPEISDVYITAEYGNTDGHSTGHTYERNGGYTLRICDDLKDAPLHVMRGAIGAELLQIAEKENSFIIYSWICLREKVSRSFSIRVSRSDDINIIKRGLGDDYLAFKRHIVNECGYEWNELDGFCLDDIEMIVNAYNNHKRFVDMITKGSIE